MLLESGDLIPVKKAAVDIPWTKRKSMIFTFLHRGPVEFTTYVYDTNVGDIAPLSTYFNPYHWTIEDLNIKFALKPAHNIPRESMISNSPPREVDPNDAKSQSLKPRLFVYPTEEEMAAQSRPSIEMLNPSQGLFFQMPNQSSSEVPNPSYPSCSGSLLKVMETSNNLTSSNCDCCQSDEWKLGSIFRPKPGRSSSVPTQKEPGVADSPEQMWLPVPSGDSDSVFRSNSVSPSDSLNPIGPPKRLKLTVPSPSFDSGWPDFGELKRKRENPFTTEVLRSTCENPLAESLKSSYFAILTEDSPWSPWPSVHTPKFDLTADEVKAQEEDLVSSLRKIAHQSNFFFA